MAHAASAIGAAAVLALTAAMAAPGSAAAAPVGSGAEPTPAHRGTKRTGRSPPYGVSAPKVVQNAAAEVRRASIGR